jgi:hypothetical protein
VEGQGIVVQKRARWIITLAVIVVFATIGYLWMMPGDDIMTASLKGDTKRVGALLWRHPKLAGATTYHKYTPLHWAAMDGHLEMARSLIKAGADVNALSQEKVSPLYLAAQKGHVEIAKLLLDNRADPNAAAEYNGGHYDLHWYNNGFFGCTPLFVAAELDKSFYATSNS